MNSNIIDNNMTPPQSNSLSIRPWLWTMHLIMIFITLALLADFGLHYFHELQIDSKEDHSSLLVLIIALGLQIFIATYVTFKLDRENRTQIKRLSETQETIQNLNIHLEQKVIEHDLSVTDHSGFLVTLGYNHK